MYEDKRLESIKKLKILDTIPEEIYDDIVKRVKEKFDVPIALLSIVDRDRQWFKSCIGVDDTETPRSASFCSRAIQEDKPLVIPNATLDPRFMDNELVTSEFGLRFYAGVPIKTPDNYMLGTICILDKKPREFLKNDEEELINFAKLIELELVERQKKIDAEKYLQKNPDEVNESIKNYDEKYDFFRILSHELKTPLMIISGASEFLTSQYDQLDKNEHMKILQNIRDEVQSLKFLINQNLTLQKTGIYGVEKRAKESDLSTFMSQVKEKFEKVITANGMRLEIIDKTNNSCMMDKEMMFHVFSNIITNAIDYSPTDNSIITINSSSDDTYALFSISNRKINSAKKIGREIFDMENHNGGRLESNGLGLFIVKKIIDDHYGSVWVEDGENKTEFHFKIPLDYKNLS